MDQWGLTQAQFLRTFSCRSLPKTDLKSRTQQTKKRKEYKKWLLDTIIEIWSLFSEEFIRLWTSKGPDSGSEGYDQIPHQQQQHYQKLQQHFMNNLFLDTVGYTAMKMIRRIIGIAHVVDLESIKDTALRARCEINALNFARKIAKERKTAKWKSMKDVVLHFYVLLHG